MPKKKSKKMSLTYASILMGIVAVAAIIAFIISITVILTNAEKRGRESVEVFAEQTSLRLEDMLDTHSNVLRQLKSNFAGQVFTIESLQPVLQRYKDNWSASDVGVLFSDETAVGATGEAVVFDAWVDPLSVEAHTSSGRIVGNKVADDDVLVFALSADFDIDGKNCVGYFMTFPITKIDSVMENTQYAHDSSTFISVIEQDGDTIWRSNTTSWQSNMFDDLQGVKFAESGELNRIRQRISLKYSGTAIYTTEETKMILAYVPLETNYWNLVLGLSYDTVIEQSSNNILALVLIAAIVILASLCITFYFFYRQRSAELRKKQSEMQAARAISETKAKSDFLSRMSHELRTPLNGIVGMVELAQRHGGDKIKREAYLGKIKTSSEYLVSLINDILDMAKIEHNKMSFSIEPFNLLEMCQNLTDIFEPMTEEKGLKFVMDCSSISTQCVIGDEMRLKQVVINLLSNAVKFTEHGSIKCLVRNYMLDGKNQVEIKVSDTGTGISPENIERIFKPFEQENTPTSRTKTGTGLGLAICMSLVKLAGGTLVCDSTLGVGSTFTVTLPLDEALSEVHGAIEIKGDERLDGLSILLAEDNTLNAEIAEALLSDVGAKITTATNGKEAYDRFIMSSEGEFDVILMDIQMPKMDGIEATKLIRKSSHPQAKSVPIIAMTANAMSEDKEMALKAGMNDHVSKPIYVDKLSKLILQYIRKG